MKTKCNPALLLLLLLVLVCALVPVPAVAGIPTDQVRGTVEQLTGVLKNPRLKDQTRRAERRSQLRKIISARFDFAEMAKRSMGAHWRNLNQKQQAEFIALFTDLLERAYVDRIESYHDEKFSYLRERLDGTFAEVESRIVTRKGDEYSLNYKLYLMDGEWKVYDMVIENVSMVNNYRSQFNRILTRSTTEELMRRIREKQIETPGEGK